MWEEKVNWLVENYTLDEVFDMLDITPEEAFLRLIEGGYAKLPEFLDEDDEKIYG